MREFGVCNNSFQENKLLEAFIPSVIKEELSTALLMDLVTEYNNVMLESLWVF